MRTTPKSTIYKILASRRAAATLAATLGAAAILFASSPVHVVYARQISPANVQAFLESRNWRPSVAERYVRDIRIVYTNLRPQNAVGLTIEQCPATQSTVYIEESLTQDQALDIIDHEFRHIADYEAGNCSYRIEEVKRDYFALGTGYRSVAISGSLAPYYLNDFSFLQHRNIDLIYSVNWDISKLPQAYTEKYFWYMQMPSLSPTPPPTPTPTVHKIDAPRAQPNTMGYSVFLPRIDLKVAT